jgi:hypothetical protein
MWWAEALALSLRLFARCRIWLGSPGIGRGVPGGGESHSDVTIRVARGRLRLAEPSCENIVLTELRRAVWAAFAGG